MHAYNMLTYDLICVVCATIAQHCKTKMVLLPHSIPQRVRALVRFYYFSFPR